MFILFIITAILAVAALIVTLALRKRAATVTTTPYGSDPKVGVRISRWIAIGLGALALLWFALGSFYTQDAGESVLQKDVTGNIVGSTTETGLHVKAPWVDTTTFNIRNQQIVFVTSKDGSNTGGEPDGPQVTSQDQDGVTVNMDVAVRYSIRADQVTEIYKSFKSEDNFKQAFIEQDIRAATRQAPNDYSTLEMLTKRADVEQKIRSILEDRWGTTGVTVDSVSLQEIRYDKDVTDAYSKAQQAQINVTQEQAKLDAAKVSAQQKVVQAQAEADANAKLNASLTPQILQQRYLDTLKELAAKGNLVVVPEGFNGLVNVSK